MAGGDWKNYNKRYTDCKKQFEERERYLYAHVRSIERIKNKNRSEQIRKSQERKESIIVNLTKLECTLISLENDISYNLYELTDKREAWEAIKDDVQDMIEILRNEISKTKNCNDSGEIF